MADNTKLSAMQQQAKTVAEELWLHYLNQALFQKGLITEKECNRIASMIASRRMSKNK